MTRFRVDIAGENFLLNLDGEHAKFGFKTIRVIRADSAAQAERIAMIRIHHELNQSPHIVKNTPDVPRVSILSIQELKFYQRLKRKHCQGFSFNSEEPSIA